MLKTRALDVGQYFKRIDYHGSSDPTLETLTKLCCHHVAKIPYDTLDIFGGEQKNMDLDKIYNDIVINNRGGWCYEQNGLFGSVLEALGYKIELLEGSCFMPGVGEFSPQFDHILLKVTVDTLEFFVDVGYRHPSFFEPMKFDMMMEQTQMTGIYRLREPDSNVYYVEQRRKKLINKENGVEIQQRIDQSEHSISDEWKIIFKFTGTPRCWEDFEIGCKRYLSDENGYFRKNSFLEIFVEPSWFTLWGSKFIEKEFPDPLTEIISCTEILPDYDNTNAVTAEDKQRITDLIKRRFGVELNFWPQFVSRSIPSY